jgi:hypothetical protein
MKPSLSSCRPARGQDLDEAKASIHAQREAWPKRAHRDVRATPQDAGQRAAAPHTFAVPQAPPALPT